MFLITVCVLSIIIALIRKGSFANLLHSGIKASVLFILSLLLFIAVQIGYAADITIITDWSYFITLGAYLSLCIAIILNVNVWMMIMLLGTLTNFIVTFINNGKMPVSLETLTTAGLTETFVEQSHNLALVTSTTRLPFLGAIIPLPLPSIFAEVISPGTVVLAIGLFMVIQNALLGVVYEFEEDADDTEDPVSERQSQRKSKKKTKNNENEYFYNSFDDDADGDDSGKNYTVGNININALDDMDDDIDESLFTTEIPPVFDHFDDDEAEMYPSLHAQQSAFESTELPVEQPTEVQTVSPIEVISASESAIPYQPADYDDEDIDYEQLKKVMNLTDDNPTEQLSAKEDAYEDINIASEIDEAIEYLTDESTDTELKQEDASTEIDDAIAIIDEIELENQSEEETEHGSELKPDQADTFDTNDYLSEEHQPDQEEPDDFIENSELFQDSTITHENIEELYADETEESLLGSIYDQKQEEVSEEENLNEYEENDEEEYTIDYEESDALESDTLEDEEEFNEDEYEYYEEDDDDESDYEEEYEYETYENEELSFSTGALKQAQDVINQQIPQQQEIAERNKELAYDQPLEVDTDSPFIIVDGRIVENPYYKFRKNNVNPTSEVQVSTTKKDDGIYEMKSTPSRENKRPNFAPPSKNIRREQTPSTPTDTENGYEKVEMKIGDVQIKFWKKDSE